MARQKFFEMLHKGRFSPENIKTSLTNPGATIRRTPESMAFIEGAWERHLFLGNKPWPGDEKVKRFRFVGINDTADGIEVVLDPCVTYKEYLGAHTPKFKELFGVDCMPNTLAVSGLLRTADDMTLMTLRNATADYKPGGYHMSIGGYPEIGKDENPILGMLREVTEESGVFKDELKSVMYIGTVQNPWSAHPDMMFDIETTLTAAEVLKRKHDQENMLLFVPTTPNSYGHWMIGGMHANVVVPMATMLLVGQRLWGNDWHGRMLEALAEGSKDYDNVAVRQKLEKVGIAEFSKMVEQYRTDHRHLVEKAA